MARDEGDDAAARPGFGGARFDVVALVASADGLSAVNEILSQLPDDFGAAVVVVQHLGAAGSSPVDILRRRSADRRREVANGMSAEVAAEPEEA